MSSFVLENVNVPAVREEGRVGYDLRLPGCERFGRGLDKKTGYDDGSLNTLPLLARRSLPSNSLSLCVAGRFTYDQARRPAFQQPSLVLRPLLPLCRIVQTDPRSPVLDVPAAFDRSPSGD